LDQLFFQLGKRTDPGQKKFYWCPPASTTGVIFPADSKSATFCKVISCGIVHSLAARGPEPLFVDSVGGWVRFPDAVIAV
jgi:hypothetical protein